MAITRACIDGFRSNLAQSFSTWLPITWFKVKRSKVKVTAYVTGNTDSLRNLWDKLTYLSWAVGVATYLSGGRGHGHVASNGCQAEVHKQYFQNKKKPRKPQNVWRDVVRASRCNAFAIARFLVFNVLYAFIQWHSEKISSLCTNTNITKHFRMTL